MKQICIVFLVIIAFCCTTHGQDKYEYDPDLLDLGDCQIISSTLNESGDFILQEFKIEIDKTGMYYLAAWINGSLDPNGEKLEYSVLMNDEKEENKIRAGESHPHAIDFGDKVFLLNSGINKITFQTKKPDCPILNLLN